MTWGQPAAWGLLLLPLAGAFVVRRSVLNRVQPGLARVTVSGIHVRPWRSSGSRQPWWLLLALTLAVCAIARPRWGSLNQTVEEPAREILVALDLSRSMSVDDVEPSRIDRAHAVVRQLLDGLAGERAGLIVFAGGAYVQVPLSSDYQIIREFLPELRPGYMPQGGSDYTAMLRAANEGFSEEKAVDRFLVVISDGESTTTGWPAEFARLQQRGVHVIGLGVGTVDGGDVPPLRTSEKAPGRSHLEPGTLQKLAAGSQGIYRDATLKLDVKTILAESVELGRRRRQVEHEALHEEERYQWFLLPALLAGMLGLGREISVRPRARQVQRRSAKWAGPMSLAGTAVIVLALLIGSNHARAHDVSDEGDEPITAIGKLRKLIAHVAAHPFLDLNDLKRLGELTVNYGIESYSKGEGLNEGALADGIEAVRYGEQMAPDFTDWELLRSELKRLQARPMEGDPLKRPPEQKKEALDEEDIPPQTNGQGSQQTSSESTGQGGVAMSDATLGELRKESARGKIAASKVNRVRAPSNQGDLGTEDPARAATNPLRNLLLKSYRQVKKDDRPGELFQALNGQIGASAEGGKDW